MFEEIIFYNYKNTFSLLKKNNQNFHKLSSYYN